MSDLAERARATGEQVDAGYDARRTEAALAGLHGKLRRRRARRIALGSAAGMLCLLAGSLWAVRGWHQSHTQASAARTKALFSLTDGSVVTSVDPASRLLAKTVSPKLVELELVAGSARFEVAPDREREFRVRAGRVGIVVVGTKFQVERHGERTTVSVQAGKVRVAWERGQQLLEPGERGSFPPVETAGEAAPTPAAEAPAPEPEAPSAGPRAAPLHPAPDWRALANRGDFTAAYRALRDRAKPVTPTNVDDLLLAADVSRQAGHAADSVPYLERALAAHEGDARFAVVAFTLGRVRMSDLDDPAGAALAFAQARAVAPRGPLAEDALAREIEARSKSGDRTAARALAEEYVKLWPSGSRLRAVRHFGGLP
jgi:transmembrane sensor